MDVIVSTWGRQIYIVDLAAHGYSVAPQLRTGGARLAGGWRVGGGLRRGLTKQA